MPPPWLTVLAWVSLAAALVTATAIVADVRVGGHRQPMRIMEVVWPVTALYFGPLAWLGYRRWGRGRRDLDGPPAATHPDYDEPVAVAVGVSHCGAGCTLGDIGGAFLVFALGWELLGLALPVEYLVDVALAFALGIVFQYLAIAPVRGLGLRDGLIAALKADTLSLIAFEVGLFGWMAFMQLVLFPGPHLPPDHAAYWLLMQLGMIIGFATSYPVNVLLIRRGIKEAM